LVSILCFGVHFRLAVVSLVVSTSAINCREEIVSKMIHYVSSRMLNSTYFL